MASATISWSAFWAEYIAMTLFVVIGCGSAMGMAGGEGWLLQVSLTFGFAITALAYSIGHLSGGHINCAVTFGLMLTGNCEVHQGMANFAAQMLGSLSGAACLTFIHPPELDRTGGLGSNGISKPFGWHNALIGEVFGTFLLVFVVLQTACHPASAANRSQACIAIGFAVFLAHTVLIPIDGCSINPTRSFGPAVMAQVRNPDLQPFQDMWIFWAGPLLGAAAAAGIYELVKKAASADAPADKCDESAFVEVCGDRGAKLADAAAADETASKISGDSKEGRASSKGSKPGSKPGSKAPSSAASVASDRGEQLESVVIGDDGEDDDGKVQVPPQFATPIVPTSPKLGPCSADTCGGSVSCCLFFRSILAH